MSDAAASLISRPLISLAVLLPSLIAAVIIKRLYFHPLSKVPGPFWAKVSNIYPAYHAWRGTMHLDIQRCHQKYGDLIRYGPKQSISLCPADLIGIYGHGRPYRKSKGYNTMLTIPDGYGTMTSIDKTLHQKLRRVFRSCVTTESLSRLEPAISRNLQIYLAKLTREHDTDGWSRSTDMRKWNPSLGFDTMADFGFGVKPDLLRSHDRDFVCPALYMHEKKLGLWEQLPALSEMGIGNLLGSFVLRYAPNARAFALWFQTFMESAISHNSSHSHGIFSPIIHSGLGTLEKPGHNYKQMIGEGTFSTFSSADAYGLMISGLFHYLSHYPDSYQKLTSELRNKFQPGQDITWGSELESCVYLRAVIDETMRMLPAACGVHWRECELPGATIGPDYDPVALPVGTNVGMSLFSIFKDERLFRDPARFWPERWIPGHLPDSELALAKKMFTPFLIGPRNCAGGHVAIRMASIAYAYILANFDFRLGLEQHKDPAHLWSNATDGHWANLEMKVECHWTLASWPSGPFVQFRKIALHATQ